MAERDASRSDNADLSGRRSPLFYVFLVVFIAIGVFALGYMALNFGDDTTAGEGGALVGEPLDDNRNSNNEASQPARPPG